jgi:hypothetical protein
MKSLMWLVSCMLDDLSMLCCTDTARDVSYISRRVEHEGMSFLTISLSDFGRDFERSLDRGQIDPNAFAGFHRPNNRTAFPAFLQGLLGRVFDKSGKLLDEPSVDCIRSIRQICLMWKKIQLPCSEERSDDAYRQFIKCELEVPSGLSEFDSNRLGCFILLSHVVWGRVCLSVDKSIGDGTLLPRHGPGATAERISGNRKYRFCEWTTRLELSFPFTGWGLTSLSQYLEDDNCLEEVVFHEPEDERPVRVIQVPKTLKTPRIIAIEPVCMQYTQQAILEPLVRSIESHSLTAGHVNFTRQEINQRLALRGSIDGSLATIDLSEASDRVALVLVEAMLSAPGLANLREAVLACRSTRADVPGHGIIWLRKFASMGSALCFPIESMVFYTICLCAVIEKLNLPFTYSSVFEAKKHVWVYGDDIIVSADKVPAVVDWLESFRLKVNANKTFYTGRFRESCGMDAYGGYPVTPVYLRRMPPDSRRSTSEIVSLISFANQAYKAGYWQTAKETRKVVESMMGSLPNVLDTSPVLGWRSALGYYSFDRIDMNLQRPQLKGYVVSINKDEDPIDGFPALLKYFLKRGNEPVFDEDHLTKSVLSGRVNITRRWSYPY